MTPLCRNEARYNASLQVSCQVLENGAYSWKISMSWKFSFSRKYTLTRTHLNMNKSNLLSSCGKTKALFQRDVLTELGASNIYSISPSVRITCSNKLQSLKAPSYGSPTNPSVYHHLLNHAQCLSSVGLVKEQNSVDVLVLILTSHFFCLLNFLLNVFVCGASMNLEMRENG